MGWNVTVPAILIPLIRRESWHETHHGRETRQKHTYMEVLSQSKCFKNILRQIVSFHRLNQRRPTPRNATLYKESTPYTMHAPLSPYPLSIIDTIHKHPVSEENVEYTDPKTPILSIHSDACTGLRYNLLLRAAANTTPP